MIKTALTAALVLGSVSFALASEFDPNLGNRYPQATTQLQSRNVALTGSPSSAASRPGSTARRAASAAATKTCLLRWSHLRTANRFTSRIKSGAGFACKCRTPANRFPPPVLPQNSRRPPAPAVLFLSARVQARRA